MGALLKQELVRNRDLLFWGSGPGVAPKQEEVDQLNLKKFGYFRTEKEISANLKGILFLKVENSKTLPKLKSDFIRSRALYTSRMEASGAKTVSRRNFDRKITYFA